MTEIKQTAESPQAVPMERPAETASPAEPAHVERVTKKKVKDPKKGGGRACRRCGRKHALARRSCVDGGRPRGQSPG